MAIVVHCSASPEDKDIGAAEINEWHIARGFRKIGYHYVIRRDGTVELGRPEAEVGAHCADGGMNSKTIGVCLVGGTDADNPQRAENNFTPEQFKSLRELIQWIKEFNPLIKDVFGHRDVPGVKKECPCFDVRQWLKSKT